MLKIAILISSLFLTSKAKSKTPEEIGKYIYESFKVNQKELSKYLEDTSVFMLGINKKYSEMLGKDTVVYYSKKFEKFYVQKKLTINKWWQKILKSKRDCRLSPFVTQYLIQKEVNKNVGKLNSNEAVYLIVFGKNHFAIRFHITTIGRKTYLDGLGFGEIYYLNAASGIFSCTSTCKNGKEDDQICLEAVDE